MDKELENLLDNYEKVIYGQAFPIDPSMHQLHLLLDYIGNLEQQCKKQKEAINSVYDILNNFDAWLEIQDWMKIRKCIDILNEVSL